MKEIAKLKVKEEKKKLESEVNFCTNDYYVLNHFYFMFSVNSEKLNHTFCTIYHMDLSCVH